MTSPSGSLSRASGLQMRLGGQDGEEPATGHAREALQPPYSPSAPDQSQNRNTSSSSTNELSLDATSRLGFPRSQSQKSLSSQDTLSTSPYSSLQYAPRQRSNHAYRASQASFQSHESIWKQQQQQRQSHSSSNSTLPTEPLSPSLLTAFPSTGGSTSSPVLSTTAIEGVPNSIESQRSTAEQVSAADKLAKQQLRADAEDLGLRVGSVGWALLERIQSATDGEWRELGELLSRGEATLLLPTTPLASNEVTLSHAYNHTIFSTNPSFPSILFTSSLKGKEKDNADLVTFKGLRADLIDDSAQSEPILAFKSFVPRNDMSFVSQMRLATKRVDLFSTLAPLPLPDSSLAALPNFKIMAHTNNLLLPPSFSRKEQAATTPRASRSRSGSEGPFLLPDQQQTGRTPASFATLFGGRREKRMSLMASASEEGKELKELRTLNGTDLSASSIGTLHVAQPTRSISAAVIDHEIHRNHVLSDLSDSMKARIRLMLGRHTDGNPFSKDIIEVVCSFASIFVPPSSSTNVRLIQGSEIRSGSTDSEMIKSPTNAVLNAPFLYDADQLADCFQDFFSSIKCQLEDAREEDANIEQALKRIEEVITGEVYDRIFCPYMSLDIFHDEALASRIDALNGMSISLRHLGLLVPEEENQETNIVRTGLEAIVTKCGYKLQSLGDKKCTSPGDKVAALVAAHKVIVEGLTGLPKIELIDEVEVASQGNKSSKEGESTSSDNLNEAKPESSSTSSADLILPILIYCIIKSNPPKLVSNLLYIQRFRAESLIHGEASYCLVNVQAAVAFLENVEPGSLGLQSNTELVTAKELEQRRQRGNREGLSPTVEGNNSLSMPMRMRSRVAHDVGELAGMSNRAITGVLGSSLGAFGRMMGAGTNFAMGIDANQDSTKANNEGRAMKKSIEDIRGVLAGGAAAKIGSVLNKVVAMENEGKPSKEAMEPLSRPRPLPRKMSNGKLATDYGRGSEESREGLSYSGMTSSKASISNRLASIPTLSRANTSTSATSSPPTSHLNLHQNVHDAEKRSTSPLQATKNLPGLPPMVGESNSLRLNSHSYMLGPQDKNESLKSPISPTSFLDPKLLLSPTHSLSSPSATPTLQIHIPASLQSPYPPLSRPPTRTRPLHVILASTGSVASIKIPLIVKALLEHENIRIQVISTKASSRFYDQQNVISSNKDALESISTTYSLYNLAKENQEASRGDEAMNSDTLYPRLHFWRDEDEWEQWDSVGDPILHIELRRWADVVLIAPCSANTLAKINSGICDDLLSCFLRALSPSTPTYLFPAMNTLMYLHPLTARHIAFVQEVLGYHVVGPIEKRLACGDLGQGAMEEWSDIVDLVVQRYSLVKKTLPM